MKRLKKIEESENETFIKVENKILDDLKNSLGDNKHLHVVCDVLEHATLGDGKEEVWPILLGTAVEQLKQDLSSNQLKVLNIAIESFLSRLNIEIDAPSPKTKVTDVTIY